METREPSRQATAQRAGNRLPQRAHFEAMRTRLVQRRLQRLWTPRHADLVRRAAGDAASIAWETGFPLLAFPTLFDEHAGRAVTQADRQEAILTRSRRLLTRGSRALSS